LASKNYGLYIFFKVLSACSYFPALYRKTGVSGINIIPISYITAGVAANPSIHLHLSPKAIQIRYDMNYPPVMNKQLNVTKEPLI